MTTTPPFLSSDRGGEFASGGKEALATVKGATKTGVDRSSQHHGQGRVFISPGLAPVISILECVAKVVDAKSTIPEQLCSGSQENSPRRARSTPGWFRPHRWPRQDRACNCPAVAAPSEVGHGHGIEILLVLTKENEESLIRVLKGAGIDFAFRFLTALFGPGLRSLFGTGRK